MKIVILDGYTVNHGDLSWDGLKEFGELTVYDRTPTNPETILSRNGISIDPDTVSQFILCLRRGKEWFL